MKKITLMMILTILLISGNVHLALATVQDVNVVPPPAPLAPASISVSGITDTSAVISWPAVESATQYAVYVNGKQFTGSNNPGAVLTGLVPHTDYSVYVTASNAGGTSGPSQSASFTTLPPVPVAPNNINVKITGNTAVVTWQPLPANLYINKYKVYLDGQLAATVDPQTGIQSATLSGLTNGNHSVVVSGVNDNQEGPPSAAVNFIVSTIPAPNDLKMYNHSSDTIWLMWQPVPGASTYEVLANGQRVGQTIQANYAVTGLPENTTNQLSVIAVMPDGTGSEPAELTAQTTALAVPLSLSILEQKIFAYVPDLQIYMVILFAVVATLALSKVLRSSIAR